MGFLDDIEGGLGGLLSQGGPNQSTNVVGALLGGTERRRPWRHPRNPRRNGMAQHVAAWTGGQHLPVSPGQIESALGGGQVQQLASSAGLPIGDFLKHLAEHLPRRPWPPPEPNVSQLPRGARRYSLATPIVGATLMKTMILALAALALAGAASAAPVCTKGVACGNTCIAKGKVCHKPALRPRRRPASTNSTLPASASARRRAPSLPRRRSVSPSGLRRLIRGRRHRRTIEA